MIAPTTTPPIAPRVAQRSAADRARYWQQASRPVPGVWRAAKRAIDVSFGTALLLLSLPLCLLIALVIKLVSPGPVLFKQKRVGKGGKTFYLFKFRSMVDGAHLLHKEVAHLNECDGPALKIANDPRLHPLGTFLRRSSLDELPQLWNVISGDMSLVGPRPALPDEVASYQPHYHQRLTVMPGISGLWQVSGRTDVPFRRWMAMDIWYARHWSPLVDLWILLRTVPAVLGRKGAC